MSAGADRPPVAAPADADGLVLFDGVCVFCDGAVRWLVERDSAARLRFAPLQGRTAAALRARHPEIPEDVDTLVYVEGSGGRERVHLRSDAVFRVLARLDRPWRWLSWLRVLPRRLADRAYEAFARRRYERFGRYDACPLPTPDERARFLD